MRKIATAISVLVLLAVAGEDRQAYGETLPPPEPATSARFSAGQVWVYRTRPGEDASRIIVGKIEKLPKTGQTVHIKIVGLSLKNPDIGGKPGSVMQHIPIAEAGLSRSVTALESEGGDLDGFQDGYQTWLAAYRSGDAGVFTLTVAEIVEAIEQAQTNAVERKT